jgi:AAA ATPase domain
MAASLADRLNAARHRQFVGRSAELALFQNALASVESPFHILYVYGPGGVGKTALLREFAFASRQTHFPVYSVDARNFEATPEAFLGALRAVLGIDPSASAFDFLRSQPRRAALLIDTYETLASQDTWVREVFLPGLPENALVVIAGREPPAPAWQSDPGWQTLIRTIPLRNLSPEESRSYLERRAISQEQFHSILAFTHGHALALSLVADVLAQRREARFEPQAAPDVIQVLLEQFVQKVPGPAHRAALEACAMVRVTTEGLLNHMLAPHGASPVRAGSGSADGIHELFEWLRSLSFIESGRQGLFPHDLAREALVADVRWRNPEWYKELHHRARDYYAALIQSSPAPEQHRVLVDYVFLHRDNPVVRSMMEWQTGGLILPDPMRDEDREILAAMVARHEGPESAKFAQAWFARQPDGVTVYRDDSSKPLGFLAMVALQRAGPEDRRSDPATRVAWDYLQRRAPLRPGEIAAHYRFWMARDTYQDVSSVQTSIFLTTVRYQLTTPGLAYHFLPCANPDLWAGVLGYANLMRLTEADYEIDEKRYGVYAHDWRAEPPLAWLAMLAEREVTSTPSTPPPPSVPLIVLSESEFAEAVQQALRGLARQGGLRGNALLRSRLIADRVATSAGETEREAALKGLLKEVTESLKSSPRDAKLERALYHTFIKPEPTQERAAEVMDVPFSTYRRHLKTGVQRVVQELWGRELGSTVM